MVRTVFFSFHYDRDNWRASQVRNSWVTKPDRDSAGYIDGAKWEEVKRKGDEAIKKWIREQMNGCSVTAVLIGSDTYGRKWIDHEIEKSVNDGMGLVGIRIHNMKDRNGNRDSRGRNPLKNWHFEPSGEEFTDRYNTYDWVRDNGRENLGDWIEEAAKNADR